LDVVPVKHSAVKANTRSEKNLKENFDLLKLFLRKLCLALVVFLNILDFAVVDVDNDWNAIMNSFRRLALYIKRVVDGGVEAHLVFLSHVNKVVRFTDFIEFDLFVSHFDFRLLNSEQPGLSGQFVELVLCVLNKLFLEAGDNLGQWVVGILKLIPDF